MEHRKPEKCEHAAVYTTNPGGRFQAKFTDPSLTVCKKKEGCKDQLKLNGSVFCRMSPALDNVRK